MRTPHLQRSSLAVMMALVAILINGLLADIVQSLQIEEHSPVLLLVSAVAISAWYGGWGPGLVTTALCAIWNTYFFLEPTFAFRIDQASKSIEVGMFLIEGVVITSIVTALQRAQRSAAAAHAAAEQALQVRDQFLAVAAHELKNPLAAVLATTYLLQRRWSRTAEVSERDQRLLRMIVTQAKRLDSLILSLLDLSRLQAGTFVLDRQRVDLAALAQEIMDEYAVVSESHDLQFHGAAEPLWIDGDPVRLEQVLHNLIHNAIKYSPTGGRIRIVGEHHATMTCLRIQDEGIGIPAAAQEAIFDRFYRASNANTSEVKGLGIGLSVVQEIVHAHGGTITVSSDEGKGSTFTICFPRLSTTDGA